MNGYSIQGIDSVFLWDREREERFKLYYTHDRDDCPTTIIIIQSGESTEILKFSIFNYLWLLGWAKDLFAMHAQIVIDMVFG